MAMIISPGDTVRVKTLEELKKISTHTSHVPNGIALERRSSKRLFFPEMEGLCGREFIVKWVRKEFDGSMSLGLCLGRHMIAYVMADWMVDLVKDTDAGYDTKTIDEFLSDFNVAQSK